MAKAKVVENTSLIYRLSNILELQKQKRIIKKKEKAKQIKNDSKFNYLKNTMATFYKDIQEEGNNEWKSGSARNVKGSGE